MKPRAVSQQTPEKLVKCWFIVGPVLQMVDQQLNNIKKRITQTDKSVLYGLPTLM